MLVLVYCTLNLGLPLIAAAYAQRTSWENICWLFVVLAFISMLLHCIEAIYLAVRDFCAAVSIIFIMMTCIFMEYRGLTNVYGLCGALSFVFAGIVSSEGRWIKDIKNVDIFHYILALSVYLLSEGLFA